MINLSHLLKLRTVLARVGEMDNARWWNTKGQLGSMGASVLRRGMPRTHHFAQARSVFAVAAHRSREVFDFPDSYTIWNLGAEIEDQFDEQWENWLDEREEWQPFFEAVQGLKGSDLLSALKEHELITDAQVEEVSKLRRSAEGRAVQLTGYDSLSDDLVTVLAAAYARGEEGAPAIPYVKREDLG